MVRHEEGNAMKITWRLWVLGIALALSVISIISAGAGIKLVIFVLLVGILVVPYFVKSKIGIVFIIIIFLLTAGFLAYSSIQQGVIVKSVEANSDAANAGLKQGSIIKSVNGQSVTDVASYSSAINELFAKNGTIRIDITTKDNDYTFLTNQTPQITVDKIPKTNIQTGLDLRGGARALVSPVNATLDDSQFDDLLAITNQRLNAFGLSDISIRRVSDLEGNKFMLVEVAGATPADLRDLVGKQGKFEAKIGNISVFQGGNKDISDVCRNNANCAGITACNPVQGGYACNFAFTVYLKQEAAQRQADATANLGLDSSGKYLTEKIHLFVDDNEVESLLISSDLKGQATTQISIQGSGTGAMQNEAIASAKNEMNKLQTILLTGSLPYKLEIVKLDTISPFLGKEFANSIMLLGVVVFMIVSVLIFIKYRNLKISSAVILTMISEALITLAIAAFIRWNLDAPGIAGIIAGIGTGVDDQIIILDEAGGAQESSSLKERIKRALFVIIGAFLTIVAAMIPLFWAGAGMLRGFALTTIIGVSVGILVTRPAFADIVRMLKE